MATLVFVLMTRRDLQLAGSTRRQRDDITARIAEALSQSGAVLVDFSLFANLSATMRAELPARQVGTLGQRLRASGLTLDDSSESALKACGSAGEVVATLRIRFERDEPACSAALATPG
ncbi:MAG TPA: hypothetical protein VHM01_02050 [Alphaproteobacteria bacterium]|nr:hypothetical protein [Alphaproteobacteria bacterium]